MFCNKCGNDLGENPHGKFCPKCGEAIVREGNQTEEKAVKDSLQPKKRKLVGKKMGIAAVLGLVIAAVVILEHDTRAYRTLKSMENVVFLDSREVPYVYPELGLMEVCDGDYTGVFDYNWKEIIPCKYKMWGDLITYPVVHSSANRIVLKKINNGDSENSNTILFDFSGNQIKTFYKTDIREFKDGRAVIRREDSNGESIYGLIDENGKEILPCNYLRVDDFVNGLSVVKIKEGPLDIVDVNGEIKITGSETPWSKVGDIMGDSYIRIGDDSGNFGVARIEELKSGRTVIPLEYSQIAWAGNGFKVAKKSGWGVRSVDGEEIVPCRYNTVWSVGEGSIYLCVERGQDVKEGGAYTVFSSTGEKLGEYKGTEREWVWEELVVLSSKSSVDNNLTDITVLNKFGDILLQQTCSSHSIWANGNYAIKVNERESVAGNLLTDYPAMEIKNGSADAGTDSIIRRDKQKSTVYRSQGGEMTEVLALDADISFQKSRPNRTLKDLEVRNDSAWIPWLANQTYHIGILD